MSEKCSSRQCYAVAGELFGHLRKSLGFGDLVMFTRTWEQPESPQAIVYRWHFSAKGERYTCEECVLFIELESLPSVEAFAQYLSDKWKDQFRLAARPSHS